MEVSKINEELADCFSEIVGWQDQAESNLVDELIGKVKHLPTSVIVALCDSNKEGPFIIDRDQNKSDLDGVLANYEKVKKRYKKESPLNKKQLKALKSAVEAHNDWLSSDELDILGYIKNYFKLNQLEAIEVMQQYLEYAKNDYKNS